MIDTLYRGGNTFLHQYDCRLKLLLLPLLILFFFIPAPWFLSGGFLLFLVIITLAALGASDLLLPVRMIFPLLILILILTPLFYPQGLALLKFGSFVFLTDKGLLESFLYISRFTGITLIFFMLFRTTPMEDILLGLSWYRLPYTLTLVISVALRYIPHLAGLYGQITAAHALRCSVRDAPPRKGLFFRIRKIFPILVSLMIQGVKTIPVLTMALELKGIGRDNNRTRLRNLPVPVKGGRQIFLTALLLVLLIIFLLILK